MSTMTINGRLTPLPADPEALLVDVEDDDPLIDCRRHCQAQPVVVAVREERAMQIVDDRDGVERAVRERPCAALPLANAEHNLGSRGSTFSAG